MPWSRTKPTAAKYRTAEHRRTRATLMAKLKRDGQGICAEPVCVHRSRVIAPWMDLHLSHNDAGTHTLGLSHAKCNLRAAALKARRIQAQPVRYSRIW
jgi:hypothetical protein